MKLKKLKEMLEAIEDDQFYTPNYNMAIPIVESLSREKISISSLPFNNKSYNNWNDLLQDLQKMRDDPRRIEQKEAIEKEENQKRIMELHADREKKIEERKRMWEIEQAVVESQRKERKRMWEIEQAERKRKAQESPVKKIWDLYFITHIDNLQHITKDGIVASKDRPKNYRTIAKERITSTRDKTQIKPGLLLSDCAHVYFRPWNAMLSAILKHDYNTAHYNYYQHRLDEIVIIRINIDLTEHELYMVDQNAYHKHQPEDFIPSYRYMEIIPKIEKMLKETGWYNRNNEEELKRQFMAECHIPKKFPLDSLKAICIADEHSIKNKRYNFEEFYDNVKSRISPESVLTANNIEQRPELFFEGKYG